MDVTVRLYSVFRLKYEDYNSTTGIRLEIEVGSSIYDLLEKVEIEPKNVSIVRVNELIVKDFNLSLDNGDNVEIFPFYGGG
ncbi:MAG: MoaD/ThiS family protein [Bacillota bacterium]|nr:MoaD/ThiS family protein [Bacillota bacterium]